MFLKTKKHLLVLVTAIASMGIISLAFAPSDAYAQTKPPSLITSTGTNTGSKSSALIGVAPDAATGKPSDGIALEGTIPQLSRAELQRQADEENAARLAADEMEREQKHVEKSYKRASSGLLPLSPDQVRTFMQRLEETQEAALPPSDGPPKGEVKVMSLTLDPGGEPPTINLAAGYVTTIDMVDATGAPWPILDVGIGGNFEVTPTQAGSHVVRVVPLARVGNGNLSILLKDLSTPVIFRLASGGSTFHMRYDARVPKLGPNAKTPLIERGRKGPLAGDQIITMILENAPPKEAKRLKIAGLDARTMAWKLGDKVFVRSPLSMLSPAWNASASSPDGMNVYEIGDAPILLMSDEGAMIRARLLQEDEHDK